jgi:hypothetical protein
MMRLETFKAGGASVILTTSLPELAKIVGEGGIVEAGGGTRMFEVGGAGIVELEGAGIVELEGAGVLEVGGVGKTDGFGV